MVNYICVYTRDIPVEIKTPADWNLIGRSMTAPPPVLSPSSISAPPSSYCAFIPGREKSPLVLKMLLFKFFTLFRRVRKIEKSGC
jgi:hypothetical protein